MNFRYMASYEALERGLVGIELENGWPVCICTCYRRVHLREIILADLQLWLLCLGKHRTASLRERLVLVSANRRHGFIVGYHVIFPYELVCCYYRKLLLVYLKLVFMVPRLHLDQIILGKPCPPYLAFTVIFVIIYHKAVSEL